MSDTEQKVPPKVNDRKHLKTVTCRYCQHPGLVWGMVNYRWKLCYPNPDGSANRLQPHDCIYAPGGVNQRSHKRSDWRRGKSPGSYG